MFELAGELIRPIKYGYTLYLSVADIKTTRGIRKHP